MMSGTSIYPRIEPIRVTHNDNPPRIHTDTDTCSVSVNLTDILPEMRYQGMRWRGGEGFVG